MAHRFPATLVDGYNRFREQDFDVNKSEYRAMAVYGQSPKAMVVSCSDSRIHPEAVFAAGAGELFVVRNVANLVPPYETGGNYHGVSAALEFGCLSLRVPDLIVLGHAQCGGIRAAYEMEFDEGNLDERGDFVKRWMGIVGDARTAVVAAHEGAPRHVHLAALEREAIRTSLANLRTFPCIRTLEEKGRLSIHGAYYDIAEGDLYVLDEAIGEFVKI
ncbi:MAG: carbonic anhydrase [Hyphomicrobiales bacterium]|nr:carbonic anhydrase [Hyphomicrobiales bacterium]